MFERKKERIAFYDGLPKFRSGILIGRFCGSDSNGCYFRLATAALNQPVNTGSRPQEEGDPRQRKAPAHHA